MSVAVLKSLELACADLGKFAGGDSSKLAVAVLDACEKSYLDEMVEAKIDRVQELQCFIRQIRALRTVLVGKGGTPLI